MSFDSHTFIPLSTLHSTLHMYLSMRLVVVCKVDCNKGLQLIERPSVIIKEMVGGILKCVIKGRSKSLALWVRFGPWSVNIPEEGQLGRHHQMS